MKVLVAVFGVLIVQGAFGCLPTSENNPSAAYPECACSKPEISVGFLANAGYSTQQALPDNCKTFTYVCANQYLDLISNTVNIHFDGEIVEYPETLKRLELTCDPTTRTYSAEGHTGIKAIGCSLNDIEALGVSPEELAQQNALLAGGGGVGEIGACNSCDPKTIHAQAISSGAIINQKISADCNTITWTCNGIGNDLMYILFTLDGEISDVMTPNSDTATITATCDGNGNYFVDGIDKPIRAINCALVA